MDASIREQLRRYDASPNDEAAHKLVAALRRIVELPAEPDDYDVWVMLLSTIRYSMGRRTYMPSLCREYYHRYKHTLNDYQRKQIGEEIQQEINRHQSLYNSALGDKCDHEVWEALIADIAKELGE